MKNSDRDRWLFLYPVALVVFILGTMICMACKQEPTAPAQSQSGKETAVIVFNLKTLECGNAPNLGKFVRPSFVVSSYLMGSKALPLDNVRFRELGADEKPSVEFHVKGNYSDCRKDIEECLNNRLQYTVISMTRHDVLEIQRLKEEAAKRERN